VTKKVRVLLVDDSRVQRAAMKAILARSPDLDVVATAEDGIAAVAAVLEHRPDVVCMDVRMPRLDGLEATRRIMAERPTPILLVTAEDNLATDVDLALRALEAGALDVLPKPANLEGGGPAGGDTQGARLAARLRLLAGVPVISHPAHRLRKPGVEAKPPADDADRTKTTFHRRAGRVVAIVASTGGPSALRALLGALPRDLKAALVVVQHIDAAFEEGLVKWLDEETPLAVVSPVDGQDLHQGTIYVAPQRRFCEVTDRRRLALREEPYSAGAHCPSGDRLMTTTAAAYGRNAIGVVLTGMGVDGAAGLLAMRRAGALTIAQDEATSVIYGMPQAAAQNGAALKVLPLDRIAAAIVEALQ